MDLNSKDWKNKKESDSNSICLDVRTKDEFDEGYINGAINVDFYDSANFVSHLSKIDKKNPVMFIADQEREVMRLVKL